MRKHQLWPLLLPFSFILLAAIFFPLNGWMKSHGFECMLRKATGLYCAGCGGTRCAKSMLIGDLQSAMSHNAFITIGFFIFIAVSTYLIIRVTVLGLAAPKIGKGVPWWIGAGITAIVIFTIMRNLPSSPWSYLAP